MTKDKDNIKSSLHQRNRNRYPYDLDALILVRPALKNHIKTNKYGNLSIDFAHPNAVKLLNQALLSHYYGIPNWDFPQENLCPPIPGRADYIHYIADLLGNEHKKEITCMDIGVGATCIYPILGVVEYDWKFIGVDVLPKSLTAAKKIVAANPLLQDKIKFRLQKNPNHIFQGVINKKDKIDITICNPPFHASIKEAQQANRRKTKNLKQKSTLNFAGNQRELVYEGGEYHFISTMIQQSRLFTNNCTWFTTLVSKSAHLDGLQKLLEKYKATTIKIIPMGTGNKVTRILAWRF